MFGVLPVQFARNRIVAGRVLGELHMVIIALLPLARILGRGVLAGLVLPRLETRAVVALRAAIGAVVVWS